jgi:hypothetical protein
MATLYNRQFSVCLDKQEESAQLWDDLAPKRSWRIEEMLDQSGNFQQFGAKRQDGSI